MKKGLNIGRFNIWTERRLVYSSQRAIIFKMSGVLCAIIIAGVIIYLNGISPWMMISKIGTSIFGTAYGLQQLLIMATPILLFGTALLLSRSVGLLNFGMEGQFYVGAWAGAIIGLFVDGPPALMLILMFVSGSIAGALFVLIPAVLRIKYGINEILTTIMFNSIATYFVLLFVMDKWRQASSIVLNNTADMKYALPTLAGELHVGILIAIVIIVLVYFLLEKTIWGYEVTSIGNNPKTARYAGIDVTRKMYTAILASGAISGIAGVIELTGTTHHLSASLSIGYSWVGVNVAFLAASSPLTLIPYGLFMALITNAGVVFQTRGLSVDMILAITGLILIFAAVGDYVSNFDILIGRVKPGTCEPGFEGGKEWSS